VPLKGSYDSPFTALKSRDAYDNHPAVESNLENVEAKFAKEEGKLFHIHLPRFLLYFIAGLILNPIQWAVQKGKGRICINCTNGPDGANTTSSENTFIPSPKAGDANACRRVPTSVLCNSIPLSSSTSVENANHVPDHKYLTTL
jgi:hypothetical protein